MKAYIETACFHNSSGTTLIHASNKNAEWIKELTDIRECFGQLFTKESGDSILLLKPVDTGLLLIVSKVMHNRYGDNLTAYLHLPLGLKISGEELFGMIMDVISSLAHNRRDVVSNCLNGISLKEFEAETIEKFKWSIPNEKKFAYRIVSSTYNDSGYCIFDVLSNPFQPYYGEFEYTYLAIDDQYIANFNQHTDISKFEILIPYKEHAKKDTKSNNVIDQNEVVKEDDNNSLTNDNSQNESANECEVTSEWLKQNTDIGGWLILFFIAVTFGGIFSAIYPLVTFKSEDYAGNFCLASVDIIIGFSLLFVAILTIYSFVNRKPSAVFWGKVYVAIVFLTNFLSIISGNLEGTGIQSVTQAIKGLLWGTIWFLYLTFSKQVNGIIPKTFRKIKSSYWAIVGCIILTPIFMYILGYSQINKLVDQRNNNETEFLAKPLDFNERTDGRVIFSIPTDFTCEEQNVDVEGNLLKIFSLKSSTDGNCTMCSDYDVDKSDRNFLSYWESWKDEDTNKYSSTNIDMGTASINGNDCKYKIMKYDINGVFVYWRFYLLFDDKTGKVFVASCYDINTSTEYTYELLNSIRF